MDQVFPPAMVNTSWYGRELQGRRMANGESFRAEDPTTAAHKELPIGTKLKLTDLETGYQLVVEIKDRGPYISGRDLDISSKAADKLGLKKNGTKVLLANIVE
ncbi:MAG: septal ring lytic transglycosylase RlpA family protein [Candidatus Paceibacterota bacterium]